MRDKIKERLQSKLKEAGVNLSTKRMDAIADRLHQKFPDITEDDIDSKLDDYYPVEDLKEVAKQDDKIRTLEAKSKPAKKESEKKEGDDKTDDEPEDEVLKELRAMRGEIESLKKEKQQTSLEQKRKELLKDIPEYVYKRIPIPDTEEALTAQADEIKADYEADRKQAKDKKIIAAGAPGGSNLKGANEKEPSKDKVQEVLKKI